MTAGDSQSSVSVWGGRLGKEQLLAVLTTPPYFLLLDLSSFFSYQH